MTTPQPTIRFLAETLAPWGRRRGWAVRAPHPTDPVCPLAWLQPMASEAPVMLAILHHQPGQAEAAWRDLAQLAAWPDQGGPHVVGCCHLFHLQDDGRALNEVARAGHTLACDTSGFIYQCEPWRRAEDLVRIFVAIDKAAKRTLSAGARHHAHSQALGAA